MNQHEVVTREVYLFLPLNSHAVTQDDTGPDLHLGAPARHLQERLPLPFRSCRGTPEEHRPQQSEGPPPEGHLGLIYSYVERKGA